MRQTMNPIATDNGRFKDGNPATGEYGTVVTAEHMNNVQDSVISMQNEIITVLNEAGIVPSEKVNTQLLEAIRTVFKTELRPYSNTKRRILHNLPITFPDYQAVLNQIKTTDTWMYPQAFTIANNVIYVLYYTNISFKGVVACFNYTTGDYLGYYILGDKQASTVAEGIVVKSNKIFAGYDGAIVEFAITSYNSVLTEGKSHDVNLSYQFNYANGEWFVEQRANRANNRTTRHRFAVFNDSFVLQRFFEVSPFQSGYPSTDEWLPKRQSAHGKAGYVLSGNGAYYDANKTITMSNHQGASLTLAGTVVAQAFYNPQKLMDKLNKLGYDTTRIENEGCFITEDNRCLTLSCINGSGSGNGGMLIVEEFSNHPNAIDFFDCSVMPQSMFDIQSPFTYVDYDMYNPLNGQKITTLAEVCMLMTTLNKNFTTIYIRSDNGLIVKDDVIIPKYSFVDIYNGDGFTHLIVVRNKKDIVGKFLYYPTNGDIRQVNENFSGSLFWSKPIGATSVYHRAYSESYNGEQYHWLDLQHSGDEHNIILGGSSAANYAFKKIRLATSKGDGGKGYYIHWNLGEDGHWLPNGTNKNVGSEAYPVQKYFGAAMDLTGTASIKQLDLTGGLHFRKTEGATSVYHRAWSEDQNGNLYHWLDLQHSTNGEHNLILGGSTDSARAFNKIRLATSKGDGGKGYYIHWNLGEDGHLMPNGSNKNIGSADVRVNELYANAPATSDVSHRVVNSSWVNSFLTSSFRQNLTKNGWQKLPSGLILQWGTYNSDNGSTFSFPIAFNSVFVAIPGDINTSGSYVANVTLTNISNTGFSVLKTGDLGAFSVIAIGV